MYRGTTPTLILNIKNPGFDMTSIVVCQVTIESKNNRVKKIYETPIIDVENRQIRVEMSQEDTLAFDAGTIRLQVRMKLTNDKVVSSQIIETVMQEVLEGSIL